MSASAERVLVIGYGNTLRGDDGVGVRVVEKLESQLAGPSALREGLSFLALHQLSPELADAVSQVDLVIFIDAAADQPAGKIVWYELGPDSTTKLGTLDHNVNPAAILALAEVAFGKRPRGVVFSIGAKEFDFSEELSPKVAAAVGEVVERVRGMIEG